MRQKGVRGEPEAHQRGARRAGEGDRSPPEAHQNGPRSPPEARPKSVRWRQKPAGSQKMPWGTGGVEQPTFPLPFAYGHTMGKTPEPVRFQKLSLIRPT